MMTELPWELGKLEDTLKMLDVQYNPLVIPPRPIVDKGTASILGWIAKNADKAKAARKGGLSPV